MLQVKSKSDEKLGRHIVFLLLHTKTSLSYYFNHVMHSIHL